MAFVGDLMHHCTQSTGAKAAAGGNGYDFTRSFDGMRDVLQGADLTVGNLETPTDGRLEDHCFPRFSAPVEYLDAVAGAGFDVLAVANNHANDRGPDGLARTVKAVTERGMVATGYAPGGEVASLERNGVRFAFVAATAFINLRCSGSPCPVMVDGQKGAEDLVERVRGASRDHEVVVVLLHWMNEGRRSANESEKKLAVDLVNAGAAVVLGGHSHVLAPASFVGVTAPETANPRGGPAPHADATRTAYIRYSLGNFVHAMKRFPTKLGGVDVVCLEPGAQGWSVASVDFTATWVRRDAGPGGRKAFQAVRLDQALAQCDKRKPENTTAGLEGMSDAECSEVRELGIYLEQHPSIPGAGRTPTVRTETK
jgi:poly-gamma-glutamate synthesis protein (capsule biosynthesis protein)